MYVCACVHVDAHVIGRAGRVLRAGLSDSYELLDMVLGPKLQASARAASILER